MEDKLKDYIRIALGHKHSVDTVIDKLVSVGHDRDHVRRLAREVIMERLQELEAEKIAGDPVSEAEKNARRAI